MPEKNIIVDRGIPMTPPSLGASTLISNPHDSGGGLDGSETSQFEREGPLGASGKFGKGPQAALDNWANAHYDTIAGGIRSNFTRALNILPQLLEGELSAIRTPGGNGGSAMEDHQRELNYRNTLIAQKHAEQAAQTLLANAFYGSDPLTSSDSGGQACH